MGFRQRLLPAIARAGPVVLRRMNASRRQRLVVEVVRAAAASSTPEQCGALHRAIASQQGTWPVSQAEQESHLVGLYAVVRETADLDGAIVECGVGRGSSLVPIARANRTFSPDRLVLGFDSFEGFPPAGAQDIGSRIAADGRVDGWWSRNTLEAVRESLDAPAKLIPGFFAVTLARSMPEQISLLHVDCDLYESTRDVLGYGLPRMQAGGIVILDEYRELDRWPGATLAIDEAFAATPHRPAWDDLLQRYVVRTPRKADDEAQRAR